MSLPHEPSSETAAQVEALAGYGIQQHEIARYLGIAEKTLRKHYRKELDTGTIKANAIVARSLHKQATEGGNVAAAIFWLKARAGWREKIDVVHKGDSENPVAVAIGTAEEFRRIATEVASRV